LATTMSFLSARHAELTEFLDALAAEANHCEDVALRNRIDQLYDRIEHAERVLGVVANLTSDEDSSEPSHRHPDQAEHLVLQLKIEHLGVEPPVWRRILLPSDSSFWDLHVAIQDAMGWHDRHLHAFSFLGTPERIGIPLDDDPAAIRPGWLHRVEEHISCSRPLALYEYDFGDSWFHEIRFEDVRDAITGATYPQCLAGERRCPPEDCGGAERYKEFLEAISDPTHPEHTDFMDWMKLTSGSFDPEAFSPQDVRFTAPSRRLRSLLNEQGTG